MQLNYDYIVVGSGASGAIAAKKLVDEGVNVAVLDIGLKDEYYHNLIPNDDFETIRKKDKQQYVYFLGKDYEGISWDSNRVGSQLTPPRNFLNKFADKLIPFGSETFHPLESLARGGLGGGWGLGCFTFSKPELEAVGLNEKEMLSAYQSVVSYIGVSGANDDATPYSLGDLKDIQNPPNIEENLKGIQQSYEKHKKNLNKKGVFVGRSGLALLTKDKPGRLATKYRDMGFWSDTNKSAYRSWITVDELLSKPNFSYHEKCVVLRFYEKDNSVKVVVKRTDTNELQVFSCKKLILAAGVLGTSRIAIRSFDYKKNKLPILSNPYSYVPCLQWRRLGKKVEQYKISFSQLTLYLDENRNNFDVGVASLFSYRSLLLFKLIKESPMNFADSRILMQFLQSSFTIAGIHHPERRSPNKFIQLEKDSNSFTGDVLKGSYELSEDELKTNSDRERKICQVLKKLGCFPLKTIPTPYGASIHYGGSMSFDDSGEFFTISKSGKLGGTKNVYVADSSGFGYLPAKGVTLTLMANAYRVAKKSLKNE
ncbi:hypothetical protein [uncultured Aquimarina sp.]|uniref:hypothetical protein n=1 Tax=uncultured Aquimarina sp. TaxID=575652 RepID=UPI0026209B9E|nr:hypothetical protein [uncultured Aquimarina sp.]